MTGMDITIHQTFLPQDDPDTALAFYRDTIGFEVRNDVGYGGMRWITVGPVGQPGTSIVLYPPAAAPGITDDERRTIAEMMAKGSYAAINLATADLDGTFDQLDAAGAEVVQEPTEQPYGMRDCAFRDPAGNLIRIQQLRLPLQDPHAWSRPRTCACAGPGALEPRRQRPQRPQAAAEAKALRQCAAQRPAALARRGCGDGA